MHNLINNTVFQCLIFCEDMSLKLLATVTTHVVKRFFNIYLTGSIHEHNLCLTFSIYCAIIAVQIHCKAFHFNS